MTDLGWENMGGEVAEKIRSYVENCQAQGHKRMESNEGMNGTVHTVSCEPCGYLYHYDSGD